MISISPRRIWAVVMRQMSLQFRDVLRIFDITYWPILDIVLWGFASAWFAREMQNDQWIKAVLTGIVLWHVMYRAILEFAVNTLEEIWDRNLVNFFVTPLSFTEWIMGLMSIGFIRAMCSLMVGSSVVWFVYDVRMWHLGWHVFPIIALLLLSGWGHGLLTATIVLGMGKNAQSIPWAFATLLAPFCGVRFPVDLLPASVQKICYVLPMTYIFESLRVYGAQGIMPYGMLLKSLVLGIIYGMGALLLFRWMFERVRNTGLSQLE